MPHALNLPMAVASGSANSAAPPIENIRVAGNGPSAPACPPVDHKSAASVAICSFILYLCIVFAGRQYYCHCRMHVAEPLPAKFDVLMTGSSVIATPLMLYEFPEQEVGFILDRCAVIETPKSEQFFESKGAHPVVYNGSALGQSIEETEQFVQNLIALHKQPRLLVLWVSPFSLLGGEGAHTNRFLHFVPAIETRLLSFWRDCKEARMAAQLRLSHLTLAVYSMLQLQDERGSSKFWMQWQDKYKDTYYRRELSKERIQVCARILNTCKSHSIQTLVVTAPLSASHRSVMPSKFYDRYHRLMSEAAQSCQSHFIDLGQSENFDDGSDFFDPVHCNAKGNEKMMRALAPVLLK